MTAILLKGEGIDTAVLFYQEAVVSFAERKFEFSPLLEKYAEKILQNINKRGHPSDPMEIIKMAKVVGVPVYICGIWAELLEVTDLIPAEMEIITMEEGVKLGAEAKKVLG